MNHQVLAESEGRTFPFAGGTLTIKEDGSRTRGGLAVVEIVLPPRSFAPPQHLHHEHEEAWYVLEGDLAFTVGDDIARVGPGSWVLVPIGVPHTFSNVGDTPARFLSTLTPGFYLHYFEELAARFDELLRSGEPYSPDILGRLGAELMSKYHTEVYPPT